MKIPVIKFDQPAGTFLLGTLRADILVQISKADPRKFDSIAMDTVGGIQREPSKQRIAEIAEYANTVDAAFPTPILLALEPGSYSLTNNHIEISGEKIADIVDGQHRILGLQKSRKMSDFEMPVVFLLDATEEQKALLFATINGKQTKVPASLIYDLFGVTKTRSPQKTAHEIARALNSMTSSPWYNRLKMLGKKSPDSIESLSQGTFIKELMPHISDDPTTDMDLLKSDKEPIIRNNCIFNEYFRKGEDATILKILVNVFQGAKEVWAEEWMDPNRYILTKTTGFSGIMKSLPQMYLKGKNARTLTKEFFATIFRSVQNDMLSNGLSFTSEDFPSGSAGERKFRDMILRHL